MKCGVSGLPVSLCTSHSQNLPRCCTQDGEVELNLKLPPFFREVRKGLHMQHSPRARVFKPRVSSGRHCFGILWLWNLGRTDLPGGSLSLRGKPCDLYSSSVSLPTCFLILPCLRATPWRSIRSGNLSPLGCLLWVFSRINWENNEYNT